MQRFVTPIHAKLSVSGSFPVSGVCPDNTSLQPLSLSCALRQGLSASESFRTASGHPAPRIMCDHTIGRIGMLEAIGEPLAINAAGCAREARITALIQIEGTATVSQGERSTEIGAGDLCLIRSGRPLMLTLDQPFRLALIEAPEHEIFHDAASSLCRWQDSLNGAGSQGLADAIINLMGTLVCCAAPDNGDCCVQQSLYQKNRIKQIIQLNLRDPALNVERIAASTGIPPRRIHRLFADEGISLMRWVWTQRLEQCYRELVQDQSGKRAISDIAYTWGFNDQAHFSRVFRKRFGISPREARRQDPDHAASTACQPRAVAS